MDRLGRKRMILIVSFIQVVKAGPLRNMNRCFSLSVCNLDAMEEIYNQDPLVSMKKKQPLPSNTQL